MESPVVATETPMEEDVPFPCKGCGEILEEGKAFELSGQRWHIDCFRCSTCNTLLDSDAHLLMLGDGSLICSNCTYSCSTCGNKIEDLAILTGDQAFCAQCFRCRNCKKKIENLRYARTSQGIFCMECHESLMQRRRKRKAGATSRKAGVKLDKSLPSLPPNMEVRSVDESETFAEATTDSHQASEADNLILPSSTYRSSRQSMGPADTDADGEFLIPLAFDPSTEGQRQDPPRDDSTAKSDQEPVSRASLESPSLHIAYQEKSRQRGETDATATFNDKTSAKPTESGKFEKTASARSSVSDLPITLKEASALTGLANSASNQPNKGQSGPLDSAARAPGRPSSELRRLHEHGSADSSRSLNTNMAQLPKRGDSLETKLHQIPRKEIGATPRSGSSGLSSHGESPRLRSESAADSRQNHFTSASSTPQLGSQPDRSGSPALMQYSSGGEVPPDEDLALAAQTGESFLRRVSNSVRHGRSFSDKSMRAGKDPKSPKSPATGSLVGTDISSPAAEKADEVAWLRGELRKERQRISEMENALRGQADVKQVNTELSEKRSTMVVLDARREVVLRELKVLTDHLEKEKRGANGEPLDLGKLSNKVLRELAESIKKLKESYTPQIEDLMQKRNNLSEELATVNRQKEQSLKEFEQLSSKNAQLAELNNQLVHQIQELYKSHSEQRGANGLVIHSYGREKSTNALEALKPAINELMPSATTTYIAEEGEPTTATATVVPGPQVVSIRKGQPRKFNWKKSGQNVAKGVKGLKGAFMSSEHEAAGGLPRSQTQDPSRQGFGFFGNQRNKQGGKMSQADSVPVLAENATNGLFGTELEARMEHEKSIIPAVVTRCIQEVELRGMDMEGIYRKSGAASAIQIIRDGFEKSPSDYDISDPDLDIHAVTSALKQYFRKLPTPLITYEVYETVIDTGDISSDAGRIEALQKGLQELPRVHRDVLEFLIFHLKRVVERHEENLMTSQNIAVVFAPTIMRPESLAREMTDVQKKNDVMKFLVDNCQEVFMGLQG